MDPTLMLFAAQAAGIVGNAVQTKRENRYLRQAESRLNAYESEYSAYEQEALNINEQVYGNTEAAIGVERNLLGLRMEQEALAYTEQSIQASEELRSVLSSQRAIFGARNQDAGQGSARAHAQSSLSAFGKDERARAISQNFRNLMIKGQAALYDVKSQANLIQKGANANQIKAQGAATRAGIFGQKGDLKNKRSQNNANLFQDIMGKVPFSEFSGIYLNNSNINSSGNSRGYNPGTKLTEGQRSRIIRSL
jgi:hypothetical protein